MNITLTPAHPDLCPGNPTQCDECDNLICCTNFNGLCDQCRAEHGGCEIVTTS